jgi:ionotropic glutamate receptor NMDA 2B
MTGYGIALPRGSKYKELIDRKLLEYSHSGELERSQRYWFYGVCKNKFDDKTSSHPLDIKNFTSAFVLLVFGTIISLIILFVDHVYQRILSKRIKTIINNNINEKTIEIQNKFISTVSSIKYNYLLCN